MITAACNLVFGTAWGLLTPVALADACSSKMPKPHHPASPHLKSVGNASHTRAVVTDLTISFCAVPEVACDRIPEPATSKWSRVDKDLYLHSAPQSAWLLIAEVDEDELKADDLVVTDVRVEGHESHDHEDGPGVSENNPVGCPRITTPAWESRPGGIQVARTRYGDIIFQARLKGVSPVTGIDVLFGADAVDPRPYWTLLPHPLQLPSAQPDVPVPKLTIRQMRQGVAPAPEPRVPLRAREDGTFKIVQISDTHMVTGVGVCNDAVGARGEPLPPRVADPLTVDFLGGVLDLEEPDLVVLTGDQLHHDVPDSQSALFKVVGPLIAREIPHAAVFGNHDSEGAHALSREAQMSLLEDLPFSLCQAGPEDVDGVGNYYLSVLGPRSSYRPESEASLATLYFVDSHGQVPSDVKDPDYDPIRQSQIDWFTRTSQSLRRAREDFKREGDGNCNDRPHLSLAYFHIPLPEFEDKNLVTMGGKRREPTEGPSFNSHFYDALSREGVVAVGCGHDHVNDFCGLLPQRHGNDGDEVEEDPGPSGEQNAGPRFGPWLCYGGGIGFGGYCSYGGNRYHRRTRVWELDTQTGGVRTWKRVEYSPGKVDELVLVDAGAVIEPRAPRDVEEGHGTVMQAEL